MSDEHLWPCRGIAEYAYCPRLFYYMAVEGIFVPSHDTEKGAAIHKRVDRPSAEAKEDDPDKPRSVRSMSLSSAKLGLTAVLDLAEIEGDVAVPVEYRKGRPCRRHEPAPAEDELTSEPRLPIPGSGPEPWPTDRVQVGLQALLLREAGYRVEEAVLYYAAEKLRLRIPVTEALTREALETLEAAKECAKGPRPMPLVNDRRCEGCSLQPVCLPDEVNQQRLMRVTVEGEGPEGKTEHGQDGRATSPRRLWPARDDGIHVVTQQQGVRVGVRGMSLRVTDREGELVKELPLANVESLAVLGGVQVSTQAITALADAQVPVAFLSSAGRLVAMMDPLGPVSAAVRRGQMKRLEDADSCLTLAKALVAAKIGNQRTLLMRNHAEPSGRTSAELQQCIADAERSVTMDELRGHEGNAAAMYFGHFAGMFRGPGAELGREFDANGRQRRPPPDPVNAVISFAYTMLTHECVAALRLAGLEPTIGALHTTRPGRPALALDLMEPFRPLIADSVAISAFNRGELGEGHFLRTAAGCALTDAGRRGFFGAYGRRMETEVTHPVFEYRLSYRRMLMLHARMIAAWMVGEVPGLAFLTTR
jgi:CRISPR-associated protein Cas1